MQIQGMLFQGDMNSVRSLGKVCVTVVSYEPEESSERKVCIKRHSLLIKWLLSPPLTPSSDEGMHSKEN